MKKIDLMLKLLFAVLFANASFGQGGVLLGGPDCESAVEIVPMNGYIVPYNSCVSYDNWYSFVAPCDGKLTVQHTSPNETDKRIYSGECGSLTEEAYGAWNTASINYDMEAGEESFIHLYTSWDCAATFNVSFDDPACPRPTSPDAIVTGWNTALFAWFAGSDAVDLVYGPVGFDPEIEGTWILGDDDGFTEVDDLEELTCYEYYVYPVCGGIRGCLSAKSGIFCTPAICPSPLNPQEIGVTSMETTITWDQGADEDEWDVQWGPDGFELGDGLGDLTYYPFDSRDIDGLDPATCYDWYVRAVCYEDADGDGVDEEYHSLWVGPNEWCTDANCIDPSDGTMLASGGLSATLSWESNNDPEENEWNIQYGTPGFELGAGVTITNIPTNPFTVTGLSPGTDYCYYVQAVCGEGPDSLSGWAGPFCFTTSTFCAAPASLSALPDSPSEASLAWFETGSATEWEVSWGIELDDPMDGSIESAVGFPALGLTGLTPGADYCYYVRANCGEGADSASTWSGPRCWTQPALCATPFALDVINITNTAAHINFVAPEGETYDVEWGAPCFNVESGEEIGSVDGTSDKPYYMTGLEPNTPYWVYVRSTCGVDSVSAWAGPILFGTDLTNDNPCGAETLVMDGLPVLRHNFDATILPGEAAIAPPEADCYSNDGWCSGDGVDRTVWFKFTAPASGKAKVSTFDASECITNGYTEIAVYSAGDCGAIGGFTPVYANSLADGADEPPYGSEVVACGLTPGQTYYVMVNPIGYIQPEVHFGISLSSVEDISAGLGLSPTICAGESYDLFNAIAGESSEDGTWYNPTVGPGNEVSNEIVFPDGEGSFDLYYVLDNGCDADTVMTVVSTNEGLYAGGDGFYTACNSYPIVLSDHLGGSYDGGGIWDYVGVAPGVALAGGLFTTFDMAPGTYPFLYTVANEYCPSDSAWVYITLFDCSSVNEESLNELVVYPNPVVDLLTIQNVSIEGNAVIEVLDVEGRVVISNQVSNVYGNYQIDMSAIESGVYFVKVTSDDSVQKVRVVKQ